MSANERDYARKTLVMEWTERFEWRTVIGTDFNSAVDAVRQAMEASGITLGGRPAVDPLSIRFRVEE